MTGHLTAAELRDRYLRFFAARGHAVVPGASLVPDDPEVLFTTAGMHPLLPYFRGREHPAGPRIVDVQPCLRTVDIDEVGDDTHLTYFEMLGNWSFGDYGRREAITWSHEFLTEVLGLDPARLHVTVFAGNDVSPRDEVSAQLWRDLGIDRISYLGEDDNWWSAGEQGPCGPDTEVFLQVGDELVEIWNNVFIEFDRRDGRYEPLPRPCVDTGMGLERTLLAIEGVSSVYETSALAPLVEALDTGADQRSVRILADHVRAVAAILADPVPTLPSNHGRGYVLRRLIRRAVRAGRVLGVPSDRWIALAGDRVPDRADHVVAQLTAEVRRFERALDRGSRVLNHRLQALTRRGSTLLPATDVDDLFDTYGLPAEITAELATEAGFSVEGVAVPRTEAGRRRRTLPAPPRIVAGSLIEPDSDPARPWLHLLHDEQRPVVIEARPPELVEWSSLWPSRPDARVRFDIRPDGEGTDLTWTLLLAEPLPDDSKLGHLRKRINQLIHANLRYTYG